MLHVTLHRFSATTIYLLSGPCSVFISSSAPQSLPFTGFLPPWSWFLIQKKPFLQKKLWCWYFCSFLEEISAFKLGLVPFIRIKQGPPMMTMFTNWMMFLITKLVVVRWWCLWCEEQVMMPWMMVLMVDVVVRWWCWWSRWWCSWW